MLRKVVVLEVLSAAERCPSIERAFGADRLAYILTRCRCEFSGSMMLLACRVPAVSYKRISSFISRFLRSGLLTQHPG